MNVRFGLVLLGALLGGQVHGRELPQSSACQAAIKALSDAEDALIAAGAASSAAASDEERQRSISAQLFPLRKRVADICLGGLTKSPSPSQHTWAAPPMPVRPPVALPRLPQPAIPPVTSTAPPRYEAPVTITTCNAAVCLGSDGSTMTRVGPTLVGPRGMCTKQGAVVICP
ncbi:MAG: hypothetical protein EOP39_23815 [Rubrivivax sp.]|nr:MAG: hypothetical protein EOP39_23815 [Rubrivivax sp.]